MGKLDSRATVAFVGVGWLAWAVLALLWGCEDAPGGVIAGGDGAPSAPADGGSETFAPDAASPTSMTGATSEQLQKGESLYAKHCVACHGSDGSGTQFGIALTRDLGFDNLVAKIDQAMPAGDPAACTGECAMLVALFVQERFVLGAGEASAGCDGERPGPRQLRLMTRREYTRTLGDLLGIALPDVANLPVEPRVGGFDNNAKAAVVTSRHADGYMELAGDLAERVLSENRGLVGCDSGCEDTFVRTFGKRAFRRPLTDDEVQRYLALFDPGLTEGSFDMGVQLTITSMLVSPHFLYRSELGEGAGGTYLLTPYEVASALSYTFWGTMPDDTLFAAADAGQLQTPEQLAMQAERLLADDRAAEQLGDFATQWLRTEGVLGANKDNQLYPGFSEGVRTSLMREQSRFFEHLFLDTEGHFAELFQADYVFANSTLAAFYGLQDPGSGDELSSTPASAESGRGGILGLGAVLAAHAHQNESSPIKRGLFVRDRLLCQTLPAPPADLDTTPPGLDPSLTTRERFAKHTESDACHSCHKYIDGVGFGLEGFDGVGARRESENGLPVDESGEVLGLESLDSDELIPFEGPRALADMLAESERAPYCLATQYFRYAGGRKDQSGDQCNAEALGDAFFEAGLSLPELLVGITQLQSFMTRQDTTP